MSHRGIQFMQGGHFACLSYSRRWIIIYHGQVKAFFYGKYHHWRRRRKEETQAPS